MAAVTNLLLAGPGIPRIKSTVGYSGTADTLYPTKNLFGQTKGELFQSATATSGDHRFSFSGGPTASANFLYIGKANLLQDAGVGTVTLKGHGSNDYGAATTVTTVSSFGSATLYGPDADDYYATFATSSAYAWWFVNHNAAGATLATHAKFFFGQSVDLGRDPVQINWRRTRASGARRRSTYGLDIAWDGLTYEAVESLQDTFGRTQRYVPCVLFTTTDHELLLDHRVLFCRVITLEIEPVVTNVFSASMSVEEVP